MAGEIIGGPGHEGPNVFRWRNSWWLLADYWHGLGVFHSPDAVTWTRQEKNILQEPGRRSEDGVMGGHADVLVQGDDAWVFYFTHPGRVADAYPPRVIPAGVQEPYATRRTSIQVAKLDLEGKQVVCHRDQPFPFYLRPGQDNWA